MAWIVDTEPDMAEPRDGEKTVVIPVVPTSITATQVIAVILSLAACRYCERHPRAAPGGGADRGGAGARSSACSARVMPRWLASAVVVIGIAAAFGLTAWTLSDEVSAFSQRLPSLVREIRATIQSASPRQSLMRQLQQAVTELEQTTTRAEADDRDAGHDRRDDRCAAVDVELRANRRLAISGRRILLMFLIYFLLASGEMFKVKLVKLSGERLSQKKVTVQMIDEIITQIGRFVFYQFWSGLLVGVLTWLAFMWMGVRYAGLWGVAAGVLNCIPYFGPTIIMVTSAVAAALQFRSLVDDRTGRRWCHSRSRRSRASCSRRSRWDARPA